MKKILVIALLVASLDVHAQSAESFFETGKKELSAKNYFLAMHNFSKAIEADSLAKYFTWRASAFMWMGSDMPAIKDFSQAIKLGDRRKENFESRAKLYFKASKFNEANKDFNYLIELGTVSNEIMYLSAMTNYRLSNLDIALARFKSIEDSFGDNYTYLNYHGLMLLDLTRFEESITYFDKAIKLDPSNWSAFNNKAAALNYLEKYDKAVVLASAAIERNESAAMPYNHRAFANTMLGQVEESIKDIEKCILLDPHYSKVYYTKGLVDEKLMDNQDALESFQKSMDLTPGYLSFYQYPYRAWKRVKAKLDEQLPARIVLFNPSAEIARIGRPLVSASLEYNISGQVFNSHKVDALLLNGTRVDYDDSGFFNTHVALKEEDLTIRLRLMKDAKVLEEKMFTLAGKSSPLIQAEHRFDATNYAILIGVEDYAHPQMGDLSKPIDDAELLKRALVSNYQFEEHNVKILKNPDQKKLFTILDNFSQSLTDKDNLLIFYAGHGHWDEKLKKGYWMLADASPGDRSTWFANSDFKDYISIIESKHLLLIADACFSGGIFKSRSAFQGPSREIKSLYESKSRKAMTSGDLKKVPDESVFLQFLVKNLESNNSKYLSSETIFNAIKNPVISNSNNKPQFGSIDGVGGEGGDFIFMKR
ncbi:MAG: caspase family protein [Cyclobacteriaceae bacterium]